MTVIRFIALVAGMIVTIAPFVAAAGPLPAAESIPLLDPSEGLGHANPGVVYRAIAQTKGLSPDGQRKASLRYTFSLPRDFKTDQPRPLVVYLHGHDVDFRWGHATLHPEAARPGDISVCLDGLTEVEDGTRVFRADQPSAVAFRDVVLELARVFPTSRIVLVGYRQGGRFAVLFAGAFPRLIDGVVAINAGMQEGSPLQGALQSIPMVFVHGLADQTTPFALSLDVVHKLGEAGHPMAMLRAIPGVDDLPPADALTDSIEWVLGMTTEDPSAALDSAREILKPPAPGSVTPPAFALARAIFRRFQVEPKSKPAKGQPWSPPFKPRKGADGRPIEPLIPDDVKAQAWRELVQVEAHARRHVAALRAAGLSSPADLDRSVSPVAGHLLAFSEDFRGVDSAEEYLVELGFKERWAAHAEAALDVWRVKGDEARDWSPARKLEAVSSSLPKCWLYAGMPPGLYADVELWRAAEGDGAPDEAARARSKVVDDWAHGMDAGLAAYRAIWSTWGR